MVLLTSIVVIKGGGTPSKSKPEYWNGDIPWVSVKDFKSSSLSGSSDHITQEGIDNSAASLIPKGNLIVPTRMALGKIAVNSVNIAINQDLKALIIKDNKEVDRNYLLRCIESKSEEIIRQGKGATVKGITLDVLKNLEIPLPPIETQKQIAAVLEKADQLRKDCQQMEQELNSLAQSVFIDMFGDPVTNPKGWEKKLLSELVENKGDIKCGPFGTQLSKSEFTTSGIPLWGIRHVNSGFCKPTIEFVSSEKARALQAYSIEPGDIVMTRKGNVGNCFIYPERLVSGVMHSDLLRIRPCNNKVDSSFLQKQFMYSRDIEDQLRLISQGAIMAGINVTKLKSLVILCPPIREQEKYAKALRVIDGQKKTLSKYLEEAGSAFNALMQKAFKGELKLKKQAA